MTSISVIGLGKLGSVMAAIFASKGFRVVGVDIDPVKVKAINDRVAPVNEPGLGQLLRDRIPGVRYTSNITATTDIKKAVTETDVTFVVVATPSEPDHSFSLKYVLAACKEIGQALKTKTTKHTVVITSTVMPGATNGAIREMLEKESGLTASKDFGLCYNPEFISLGQVIADFKKPDLILIGESGFTDGNILWEIYTKTVENSPKFHRMNLINAEITKLTINTYLTTKISFANSISQICHNVVGADVDIVLGAVGSDSRIGSKFLKAGGTASGPCLPRDVEAMIKLAKDSKVTSILAEASKRTNENYVDWIYMLIIENMSSTLDAIGIIGLSYKAGSDIKEKSLGSELLIRFMRNRLYAWACEPTSSPVKVEDVIRNFQVIVLCTLHPEFLNLPTELFKGKTVIDPWRALGYLKGAEGVKYIGLGIGE